MDQRSPIRRDLLEQLDACRRGTDDLADGEMAELAERVRHDSVLADALRSVQAVDEQIANAMQQVNVPPGLVARLLAAVGTEQAPVQLAPAATAVVGVPGAAAVDSKVTADRTELPLEATAEGEPRSRRQAILGAAAMGLVAASIVAAIFFFSAPAEEVMDVETLQQLARDFYFQDLQGHPPGQQVVDGAEPLVRFPIPNDILWNPPTTTWRPISGFLGSSAGVAYDLQAGGTNATLYVVRPGAGTDTVVQNLSDHPSAKSATTSGVATATWYDSKRGLLYALVVAGGEQEFRQFVPAAQLAGVRLWPLAELHARRAA